VALIKFLRTPIQLLCLLSAILLCTPDLAHADGPLLVTVKQDEGAFMYSNLDAADKTDMKFPKGVELILGCEITRGGVKWYLIEFDTEVGSIPVKADDFEKPAATVKECPQKSLKSWS
jgi:hypothetical protein